MHIWITGGAGYIGSLLTGALLREGHQVTVIDDLVFGGETMLAYLPHPNFRFVKGDVVEAETLKRASELTQAWGVPQAAFHLAALVGFPACQQVGPQVAWRYNLESLQRVFEYVESLGTERLIFSSTYSNYGLAADDKPVDETSVLYPQSLFAETKIAGEEFLQEQSKTSRCSPIIYRFATLFGISPRTRFDLIINQFVLEALQHRKLVIYQRGYARSFVHVRDIIRALEIALASDLALTRGEIFNVGGDDMNYTKDELVRMVQQKVAGTEIEYKNLSFGGDMRDIRVSFKKIRDTLGFEPTISIEEGILEVRDAIQQGLIKDPNDSRYRNAQFIVQ
jgi:nucleoside-diphosphate-sugar epimerase